MLNAIKLINQHIASGMSRVEEFSELVLISQFTPLMRAALSEKRLEGKHGWYDPEVCDLTFLMQALQDCVDKQDWVSVANYAAMITLREEAL